MSDSLADVWNDKIKELEEQTVEREFAGFPVKARRIPLRAMLKAGSLPEVLVEHMFRLDNDAEYREQAAKAATYQQLRHNIDYQRQIITAVIAEPVLVFGREPEKGEVSYEKFVKLRPRFVDEVVAWVEAGCPDVPVAMKGGETTTVGSLANFSDKGRRRKCSKPRSSKRRDGAEAV